MSASLMLMLITLRERSLVMLPKSIWGLVKGRVAVDVIATFEFI
jgi:hypothetical protein